MLMVIYKQPDDLLPVDTSTGTLAGLGAAAPPSPSSVVAALKPCTAV